MWLTLRTTASVNLCGCNWKKNAVATTTFVVSPDNNCGWNHNLCIHTVVPDKKNVFAAINFVVASKDLVVDPENICGCSHNLCAYNQNHCGCNQKFYDCYQKQCDVILKITFVCVAAAEPQELSLWVLVVDPETFAVTTTTSVVTYKNHWGCSCVCNYKFCFCFQQQCNISF